MFPSEVVSPSLFTSCPEPRSIITLEPAPPTVVNFVLVDPSNAFDISSPSGEEGSELPLADLTKKRLERLLVKSSGVASSARRISEI